MDSGAQSAARHTIWTRTDSVSRMGKAAGKIIGRIQPTGTIKEMWRFGGQRGQPTPTGRWNLPVDRSALTTAATSGRALIKSPLSHLGPAASQMEKRGICTDKGEVNRQIAADNKLLKEIKARITRLYRWSKAEAEKTTNAAKQLDRLVGGPAAVERSPHPHRQNPGFAGKRCTIQLFCRQTASSLCSSFMKNR